MQLPVALWLALPERKQCSRADEAPKAGGGEARSPAVVLSPPDQPSRHVVGDFGTGPASGFAFLPHQFEPIRYAVDASADDGLTGAINRPHDADDTASIDSLAAVNFNA